MINNFKNWITLSEAALIRKCTVQNISFLAKKGYFQPQTKNGRIILISKKDVLSYYKTRKLGRPPKNTRWPNP
jgi:hypothetical protein